VDEGPLRVAVVGAGAFGRNHLRVYRELQESGAAVELAAVVDADARVAAEAGAAFGVAWFTSLEDCLADVELDAASVCVPTMHHAPAAEMLLAAGVDVLVEKPLAGSLADADRILGAARKSGRIVQVGHLERFNPAVTAARGQLNRPMFFESHRLSVFTARSLDVDVVLDIANVRLEFENGCIANFTASRVSTERVRKLRFFQPHQYLSLDFARQDLLMIDVTAAAGMTDAQLGAVMKLMAPAASAGQHPSAGLSLRKIAVEAGEPLRLEIEAFLAAVRARSEPLVSGADGRRALALALEIHEAMAAHARRAGLTV
jgi:predicted dehydrogenase